MSKIIQERNSAAIFLFHFLNRCFFCVKYLRFHYSFHIYLKHFSDWNINNCYCNTDGTCSRCYKIHIFLCESRKLNKLHRFIFLEIYINLLPVPFNFSFSSISLFETFLSAFVVYLFNLTMFHLFIYRLFILLCFFMRTEFHSLQGMEFLEGFGKKKQQPHQQLNNLSSIHINPLSAQSLNIHLHGILFLSIFHF